MLNNLFSAITGMSITAAIAIVVVLAVNALLRMIKAPAFIRCALWLAVLFRLLCPFAFASDISLFGWEIWQQPATVAEYSMPQIPYITFDEAATVQLSDVALPAPAPAQKQQTSPLALLWLTGLTLLLAYHSLAYLRLKKSISGATRVAGNIYQGEALRASFVCGFWRPNIYLPHNVDDKAYDYILLHEQTHINRGDYLLKPLWLFACCLHWFNPLVWLAFSRMCAEMELSCDEAVLRKLGVGVKADYCRCLVSLANKQPASGLLPGFGQRQIKGRVQHILGYKKPALGAVLLSALVVLATACAVTTNAPPAEAPPAQLLPTEEENEQRTEAELEQFIEERLAAYKEMADDSTFIERGTLNEPTDDTLQTYLQIQRELETQLYTIEEELRKYENNEEQELPEELLEQLQAGQEATAAAEELIRQILAERAANPPTINQQLAWPYIGALGELFGPRDLGFHAGLDINGPIGDAVAAAATGEVILAEWYYAYGYSIIIDHGDNLSTTYGHLSAFAVNVGDTVEQGQIIGCIGSSGNAKGPQLHFEVRVDGEVQDPLLYLPQTEEV